MTGARVGAFLLGFVLVGATRFAWDRARPGAPAAGSPATAEGHEQTRPSPSADCPADPPPRLPELRSQIAQAELEVRFAEGQEAASIGVRLDWPAGIPASVTEQGVLAGLARLADEGYAVLGPDCSEYPCTAAVLFEDPEQQGDLIDRYRALGWENVQVNVSWSERADGSLVLMQQLAILADAVSDPLAARRVSFRQEELIEVYRPEFDAALAVP